jgi:hypothetical protein
MQLAVLGYHGDNLSLKALSDNLSLKDENGAFVF